MFYFSADVCKRHNSEESITVR